MNDAIAILRVSSQKQSDNLSHATQLGEIERYCKETGLNLVRNVSIVESAKDSNNRKKYNHEIDYAVKNKIKHIVFSMFDRESRNLTDNERNEILVKSGTLSIHYAHERKVYNGETSDSDFFLRDITAATNKQFIRTITTKVLSGMKTKAEQGWFPGNKPPLGYIHCRATNAQGRENRKAPTTIIPDPNEQKVKQVQREFELRAQGYTYEKIRSIIIKEGYVESDKINSYYRSPIEARLKNKFYRGFFDWQGIEYKGAHDLVISKEILDTVDATFQERGLQAIVPDNKTLGIFGGGYLKCKICGCNVVHERRIKNNKNGTTTEYNLYRCSNGKHEHKSLKGMYVSERDIWIYFERAVDEIAITKVLAEKINNTLNATHMKAKETRKREIDNYSQALEVIDAKRDKLFDMYTQGLVDEDDYRRQAERLKDDRRNYTQLLQDVSAEIDDQLLETIKTTIELGLNAKSLWNLGTHEQRKALLDELLLNSTLDGLTVEYDLKSPFKELAELRKNDGKAEWYPQQGSNL